jgi:hypothetical protein
MTSAILDFLIDQGADFECVFTFPAPCGETVNLYGATAAMQIRPRVGDCLAVATLTTANGGLRINAAAGTITATIDATDTTEIPSGPYVYDLKLLEASGRITRPYQGSATVSGEVTTIIPPSPTPPTGGQLNFSIAANSGLIAGVM